MPVLSLNAKYWQGGVELPPVYPTVSLSFKIGGTMLIS